MAMQQLLCRHAAIAESRCSNELPSRNRATERIKKAVISLLSGKSTEPKVAKEHAASCEDDDSQGAKDHRRGVLRLRLTVPALPPEHLRSARKEEGKPERLERLQAGVNSACA